MKTPSDRIILSSPVTHCDWIWRFPKQLGHGKPSVRRICDRCKEAGWTRLYWRTFDGGRALYDSKLLESEAVGYDADCYHAWASPGQVDTSFMKGYRNFDCLAEAVEYGHKIGLEVHAWLSINEDDHAWGIASRFARHNPHLRWVKRGGIPYNSQLSFAFEEVREYKLGLLREILAYDIDGVFFDWIRTGDVRNNPQVTPCGTGDFGYEKPMIEGFKKKFGIDPHTIPNNDERWVAFRAAPITAFARQAKRLVKAKNRNLPIAAMVNHPWSYRGQDGRINGSYYGLFLDLETWVRQGLVDDLVAAGYYLKGGTAAKAYKYLRDIAGDRCNVWLYWWVPADREDFQKSLRTARRLGSPQILYWESDYVGLPPDGREQAVQAMNEYAIG
ncbi:MAG: family 10 glycosylhydrolase [Phycisphaerae bacterium]|nr:family 10 glycosylhydrolase [Phycisphaerae bacterium]